MLTFRQPLEGIERPQMEADVTIVGGGPAGLACALRLAQLIDRHNRRHPDAPLSKENIYVLEKAREMGQHSLSGALLDPRSMDELLPGWRAEAPLDAEVTHEDVYFLTEKGEHRLPITPPPLQDHAVRRRLDLWLQGQHCFAGLRDQPGLPGPAPGSPARAAAVQDASADQRAFARRQDGPLRRQDLSLWRMVFHAAAGRPWLDD